MNIKHLKPTTNEVEICGLSLLLIPFLSLLLATTAFIFGGSVGVWMFPVAVITTLVIGHLLIIGKGYKPHAHLRYYLYTLLSIAFALLSASMLYDNSYDGNTYHQGGIVDMIMGCNPIYHPEEFSSFWSTHYAKAIEISASTIAIFFNRIESGKGVNIMLIVASIYITYSFLRREFHEHSTRKVLLFTLLLTLCPVVIRQAYIYYIDYAMYTFMLLAIISLITIYRYNTPLSWCLLIITTLLAASTKFTVAFYVFLTIATAIVWYFISGRCKLSYRLITLSIILFIIGFGVIGFHPYVTNTMGWGNPFYPLMGSDTDIMSGNTPELYANGNRLSNWLRSLFYNAQGTGIWIPIINDSLHDYYISHEGRIAGLGPFFGYTLFASILFATYTFYKEKSRLTLNKSRATTFIGISLLLLVACFIFEQSWWMRYIPFLWAVPVILLLYTEQSQALSPLLQRLRCILYTLLVTTQLLCCATTIIAGGAFTQRLGGLYHAITPQSTVKVYHLIESPSFNHKLQERGIAFEELGNDEQLLPDTTIHCIHIPDNANVYVDNDTYMRMQHPDLLDIIIGNK
ncbi:MAG: hypothetical protein J6L03_04730 [Bacteroidaceae bacterium]|nr:hypothetical protein [Bacteroidaceae bacterium]